MIRLLACAIVALVLAVPAVGQPVQAGPGFTRVQIGGNLGRYEARYGLPENRSLDDPLEGPGTWPRKRSIRTVGQLGEVPTSHLQRSSAQGDTSSRHGFILRGKYHSLVPTPVPEIADVFASQMPFWVGQDVEVVGAFEENIFVIWSALALPEREDDDGLSAPRSDLETLVMDPEAAAGQLVKVEGTFRGANLFDDLPDESRRDAEDWVLNDGPFSIWVTDGKPEGPGFSLGLKTQSDCIWRLAVQGEVEIHDGYVYLKVTEARLLGRVREES